MRLFAINGDPMPIPKFGELIFKQTFSVPMKNQNHATVNPMAKKGIRDKFKRHLAFADAIREPLVRPVKLVVTRIIGPGEGEYDYDSIGRGDAKELIDTLVDLGWFENDGPRFIRGVYYDQDNKQRWAGPAVMVEVFEDE